MGDHLQWSQRLHLPRAYLTKVPGLGEYLRDDGSAMPRVHLDGGYYTRAPDNLPLLGPLPGAPAGAYVLTLTLSPNPNPNPKPDPHPNPNPTPTPNPNPKPKPGAYVCAGLSGYGVMAANAAGELLAQHVTAEPLPTYAHAFRPERWLDNDYLRSVESGAVAQGLQI